VVVALFAGRWRLHFGFFGSLRKSANQIARKRNHAPADQLIPLRSSSCDACQKFLRQQTHDLAVSWTKGLY
jgi:hypothetical protein